MLLLRPNRLQPGHQGLTELQVPEVDVSEFKCVHVYFADDSSMQQPGAAQSSKKNRKMITNHTNFACTFHFYGRVC